MALSLRQLRYFESLSRHGHFGRAAAECSVSQPALSMQIADLEASLGATLIERRRGDLKLTPAGAAVAERALGILVAVRELEAAARCGDDVLSGPLALGAIPSIAPYLLPTALPVIRERYPRLALTLHETRTADLVQELLSGRLDVIVASLPLDAPDIVTAPLFDDTFVLVAQTGSPLAQADIVDPKMLVRERLLLLEEGHCLRDQALALCGAREGEDTAFGATSLTTVVQLVANGFGVTLLPEIAVEAEILGDSRVTTVKLIPPAPKRQVALAWRASSPRQADFLQLASLLSEVAMQKNEAMPSRST